MPVQAAAQLRWSNQPLLFPALLTGKGVLPSIPVSRSKQGCLQDLRIPQTGNEFTILPPTGIVTLGSDTMALLRLTVLLRAQTRPALVPHSGVMFANDARNSFETASPSISKQLW